MCIRRALLHQQLSVSALRSQEGIDTMIRLMLYHRRHGPTISRMFSLAHREWVTALLVTSGNEPVTDAEYRALTAEPPVRRGRLHRIAGVRYDFDKYD
jgi:hypothetical protein